MITGTHCQCTVHDVSSQLLSYELIDTDGQTEALFRHYTLILVTH